MIILRSVFLSIRNFSGKFIEKFKTQVLGSIIFSENGAGFEIMWKNMTSQADHR
jgi:hypothetical protein